MPQPVIYDEYGRPVFPRARILAAVLQDDDLLWEDDYAGDEQYVRDFARESESRRQPVYNFGSINWTT